MKKVLLSAVCVLALAACNASYSVTYTLTMDTVSAADRTTLAEQAVNVMQRRLERMGEVLKDKEVKMEGSGATITVTTEHQESLDELTKELQSPFSLRMMAQVPEGQKADITVEGQGGFNETGITEDDLDWVEGRIQPGTQKGEVRLVFTPVGRAKMAGLFEKMKGKNIGLFVRNQLVSKLQVDSEKLEDDIVIREIPTGELAAIFADDVNVGIHVTFQVKK